MDFKPINALYKIENPLSLFGFHQCNEFYNLIEKVNPQAMHHIKSMFIKSNCPNVINTINTKLTEKYGDLRHQIHIMDDEDEGSIIIFNDNMLMTFNVYDTSFNNCKCARLAGSIYFKDENIKSNYLNTILEIINTSFDKIPKVAEIMYYYNNSDRTTQESFRDTIEDKFFQEAYPFIPNIENYIDAYITSSESVLILHGFPGTGKSRFIRYIMQRMLDKTNRTEDINVFYTSDEGVLLKSSFFVDFITDTSSSLLVLEDMDTAFMSRLKENTTMHKFLSTSDGIIQTSLDKKMVFSTNLMNVKDIDSALLRPGRTFDVIEFKELNYDDSMTLLKKLLPDHNEDDLNNRLNKVMDSKAEDQTNYRLANIYQIYNALMNPILDIDRLRGKRFRTGFA